MSAVKERQDVRRGVGNESTRFGAPSGPDPVEAGRKGAKSAHARRRFREIRRIEDAILESGNGAAKAAVLRVRLERAGHDRGGDRQAQVAVVVAW
jgi:hypothetical protein